MMLHPEDLKAIEDIVAKAVKKEIAETMSKAADTPSEAVKKGGK
jgi:hypothetical protein